VPHRDHGHFRGMITMPIAKIDDGPTWMCLGWVLVTLDFLGGPWEDYLGSADRPQMW